MIAEPAPAVPLSRAQLGWLAALVVLAQLPLWTHLPPWVIATGSALATARLLPRSGRQPSRVRRWLLPALALAVAIGIRWHYGYFLARDPCVAFLYVLVAIKYVEAKSTRDGGVLVCLTLFLTLTQFFYGQTIAAAVMTLPSVLALGGALTALRAAPAPASDWRLPLASTARMLAQGVPLAALLFFVFPRLAAPLWGVPLTGEARTGLSDRMAPGAISELSLSDAVAFRVDFNGLPPPPAQRYWRGPVLSHFDGFEWTARTWIRRGELPVRGPRTIDYTVTLEPSNRPWLFALEQAASLPQPAADDAQNRPRGLLPFATLTSERQLLAAVPVTRAIRYQQSSLLGDRYSAGGNADRRDNLQLPPSNARSLAFARDLRGRSVSDRAYIAAVLDWFRNEEFVYTLAPPPLPENDPVDAFLFDTRRGFCEHYAGAFVVLLRAAGIPARVVTGYQGGEINPTGGYMIVRDSDAHAWAEALVDGAWQRFDPTAAVAPWRIERGLGALPQGEPVPYLARLDMTWLKSLRLYWDAVNYQWQGSIVGFNLQRQRDLIRDLGLGDSQPWQIVALVVAIALLWALAILALSRARHARQDAAVMLWARMGRRLARAGLPRRAEEGPLDYAGRAALRWPRWSEVLRRIGQTYAALRYGPPDGAHEQRIAALRASVASLPAARALREAARRSD